jgi:glycosyltransferase involved in cell wall biosynthesis
VTDVLLVDWLPRGGIPQTTDAWRRIGIEAGLDVRVVGRAGDELRPDLAVARRVPTKVGAVEAHLRLVRRAVAAVRELRPTTLYVQHSWAPVLERRLLDAARGVGARSVLAVHNARPHERLAGLTTGRDGLLDAADVLVAHSAFVADQLGGRPSVRVPLPELASVTQAPPVPVAGLEPVAGVRRAVAFGVLHRGYKGVDALPALARELGPGWEVVAAGAGCTPQAGVRTREGYLSSGELRWLIETADAAVLPYRAASQSGAVSITQSLGVPPVATAVGGIPEQVAQGRTGILVAPDAGPERWADAVRRAGALDRAALRADAARTAGDAGAAWLDVVRRAGAGAPR